MIDPVTTTWLAPKLALMISELATIKKNQGHMLAKLDQLETAVKGISNQLDEQALVRGRSAFRALVDAINASNDLTRSQALHDAYTTFNEFMQVDATGAKAGASGTVSNAYVVWTGYWGKIYYYIIAEDPRNALLHVYQFAQQCPLVALNALSPEFFSRNYRVEIARATDHQKLMRRQFADATWQNRARKAWYFAKQTVRGAVASAGGFLAGGVLTGATGGIGTAWAVARGVYIGNMIFKKLGVADPQLEDVASIIKSIEANSSDLARLLAALQQECEHNVSRLAVVRPESIMKAWGDQVPKVLAPR